MKWREMEATPAASGGEIVFFDVETTVPFRGATAEGKGGYALLEFGAILVCPRRLVEVGSYSTLVRPADPSAISKVSVRCNGITRDAVAAAPPFQEVADTVYGILHGRVWAGHNIVRFDWPRIKEAFAEIGQPAPEPKGTIDTLPLLTQRFGRRAGDMKMASLATYFGLGQQKHRSLDDVRLNLEVLKNCSAVLFLELSLPDVFTENCLGYERTTTRSHDVVCTPSEERSPDLNSDPSFSDQQKITHMLAKTSVEGNIAVDNDLVSEPGPSDLMACMEEMKIDERASPSCGRSPELTPETICRTFAAADVCSSYAGYLGPDEVSTPLISISTVPFHHSGQRLCILHRDAPLRLCYTGLRVQFGISTKFVDHAGRPKLSIVVDVPASLSHVLEFCDNVAQRSALNLGSSSEWRPVVKRSCYSKYSSVRLHIPTIANGDVSTEIYQKEPCGSTQKLVFNGSDAGELNLLFLPGTIIDAYFSAEVYDYQQYAGIRLVAKKLIVQSK